MIDMVYIISCVPVFVFKETIDVGTYIGIIIIHWYDFTVYALNYNIHLL